jgi:HAD superfamily hydrolase (TIGR01509 family)
MIKALLCDIDGTLVESNWLHAQAWKDAFAAADLEIDLEDIRRQIGKGGDELIPVFIAGPHQEVLKKPLTAYRQLLFQSKYLNQVKPFPRVREFLQRLREVGIRIALASSADQDQLEAYKRIAGMEDLIEEESSADDVERSKPHPDIFQATLKKLKIEAKDAMALGDTPYDAEAASKAGLKTIGVTSGGWSEADLLAAGCLEVYRDVAELLEKFDTSALSQK